MKIKARPEDFVVFEVADIAPEGRGPHALYRLFKRGATTWDVIGDLARRLRLRADAVRYGGLKDRHALSYQFVTIENGPRRDLEGRNYRLEYLGQTTRPMSKALLRGNRFRIVVRDCRPEGLAREVEAVSRWGVVNYFDEQRFGSVRQSGEFAAREIVLGHYERALYLLLVEGSQYEMGRTRAFRRCLRERWPAVGDCLELAPSPWERQVLAFLARHRPSRRTFRRALGLVDREYLLLLCHAYQAHLWNEAVKLYLARLGLDLFPVPYLLGELLFYERLPEERAEGLLSLKVPLPSPRLRLEAPLREVVEEVLRREGIPGLSRFRSLVRGAIFKTYPREVVVFPRDLSCEVLDRETVRLEFFLPKGSYATIVLKRLFRTGGRASGP